MSISLVDRSPYAMTNRARTYLSVAGARHFLVGAFMLSTPWLFSAAAFGPMFTAVPLDGWGVALFAVGAACAFSAIARNADVARVAMVASATISSVLGLGLAIGIGAAWSTWVQHLGWDLVSDLLATRPVAYPDGLLGLTTAPPSPMLPLALIPLAIKDLVMCAQPLRVPLEDIPQPRRRR